MTIIIFQNHKTIQKAYIYLLNIKRNKRDQRKHQRTEITYLIFKYPKEHVTGLTIT